MRFQTRREITSPFDVIVAQLPQGVQHSLGVARQSDIRHGVVTVCHHDDEIRLQRFGGLSDRAFEGRRRGARRGAKAGGNLDLGHWRAVVDMQQHELCRLAARQARRRQRCIHSCLCLVRVAHRQKETSTLQRT